jgi:hypothetical protein
MRETRAELATGAATAGSSAAAAEKASATDVILSLVRAAKAALIYLPNNEVTIRSCEELCDRVIRHTATYGEMVIEVELFSLRFKGCDIYCNSDRDDTIPFRMRSDGIRSLRFLHGVERHEVQTFLGVIAAQKGDDDLRTLLWEKSLSHLQFLCDDDLVVDDGEAPPPERRSQQEAISAILAQVADSYNPPPVMLPKHLLMLTSEEAEWLRKLRQDEAEREPIENALEVVTAILYGIEDPALFADFAGIAAALANRFLLAGDLAQAVRLLRHLRQLSRLGTLRPEQRQEVTQVIGTILSDATLPALRQALDDGDGLSPAELKELLLLLGSSALKGICELLGGVKKLKFRKVMIEALVELGRDQPELFASFLTDSRWYLVRNIILILSMLDQPGTLELIVSLAGHRESRIRKEVLAHLERSRDPRAGRYLPRFLRDPSAPLRVRALQVLVRKRSPVALKTALALAAGDRFDEIEDAEKRAICEAIGELGGENALPVLKNMLLKKKWIKKSLERGTAPFAVAGLMKVRSKEALEILEEARKQASPELEQVLDDAIQALAAPRAA